MNEKKEYTDGRVVISSREYHDLVAESKENEMEAREQRMRAYDAEKRIDELKKEIAELKKEIAEPKKSEDVSVETLIAMISSAMAGSKAPIKGGNK